MYDCVGLSTVVVAGISSTESTSLRNEYSIRSPNQYFRDMLLHIMLLAIISVSTREVTFVNPTGSFMRICHR